MTSEAVPVTLDETAAKKLLESNGFVVLREKSYRQARERLRVAEALRDAEEDRRKGAEAWGQSECAEQRRLRDRVTFLYGVGRSLGASDEELRGPS